MTAVAEPAAEPAAVAAVFRLSYWLGGREHCVYVRSCEAPAAGEPVLLTGAARLEVLVQPAP